MNQRHRLKGLFKQINRMCNRAKLRIKQAVFSVHYHSVNKFGTVELYRAFSSASKNVYQLHKPFIKLIKHFIKVLQS